MNNSFLIAIDMDGTLLNDDKKITPKTADFLRSLTKQGHCVVIATGRPLRSVLLYQKELGIDCPIVCYNGTMTLDYHHNRFPKRIVRFNKKIVKQIIDEIGIDLLDNLMVETEKHIYLLREDKELNDFFWNEGHSIIYGADFDFDDDPMTLIFKPLNNSEAIKQKMKKAVEKHKEYNLRFWYDSYYSEVFLSYGTKKHGLEYIANSLGIDHKNTIACGDAENDIQMLAWSEHAIVMVNGSPEVKEHATLITHHDNNNDGLIEAIKKTIG